MPMMGLREYARHRGCRLNAVQTALAAGRIKAVQGMINSEQADADWEANTDPIGGMRQYARQDADAASPVSPSVARERYAQIRAEREEWQRRLLQLKYEEKAGLLVSAAEVAERYEKFVHLSMTALLALPARIKGELPHLSTRDIVRIDGMVRDALEALANVGGT
jgi:phage terminase Nu1 subunit (DNA packaging protein)